MWQAAHRPKDPGFASHMTSSTGCTGALAPSVNWTRRSPLSPTAGNQLRPPQGEAQGVAQLHPAARKRGLCDAFQHLCLLLQEASSHHPGWLTPSWSKSAFEGARKAHFYLKSHIPDSYCVLGLGVTRVDMDWDSLGEGLREAGNDL